VLAGAGRSFSVGLCHLNTYFNPVANRWVNRYSAFLPRSHLIYCIRRPTPVHLTMLPLSAAEWSFFRSRPHLAVGL
jgi:hypothetical protein